MLSFRPVTDDDYEYLYALNEATMRDYAEQTYGPWDEAVNQRIFAERWRPETMQIVQVDGQDAGLLELLPTAYRSAARQHPRRIRLPGPGYRHPARRWRPARCLRARPDGDATGAESRSRPTPL